MPTKQDAPDIAREIARVNVLLQERFPQAEAPPVAYVHTYGCQQNVADSEKLKGMLAQMGYRLGETEKGADLVLFNTCAVRENAEDRVFGNVGALKAAKHDNPDMVICLCGCMVQQEHIAQKLRQSYSHIDLIFGTHALGAFPRLLFRVLSEQKRLTDLSEYEELLPEGLPVCRDSPMKAWLPVMYGCDNFCTYCVVPYVRGRERSRASGDILREFQGLVDSGCREITLLGQNVNSYGKTLADETDFSGLLRRLNGVPGDFRIRFMTSHPKDATFGLIDTIAECEKVCAHFHLPVQSGSDRILRLMNRGYTAEEYLRLVDYAREQIPDISFTSDIIVGFPGETEADFEATLNLVRRVEYDGLYSFLYSKRVGTRAADMEDAVSAKEKSARFERLLVLQRELTARRLDAAVGKTFRVLAEGPGRGADMLCGRTEQNATLDFPREYAGRPRLCEGDFYSVRVTHSSGRTLTGEVVFP